MLDEIGFQMEVFVDSRGEISAKVTDPVLQEPYTLHLVKNSSGSFVGTVKNLYEQTLFISVINASIFCRTSLCISHSSFSFFVTKSSISLQAVRMAAPL